jgi:DNA-binding NarL/FixJ family response regulator
VGAAGGLVAEALASMLATSGSRVLGSYADFHALKAALDDGLQMPHAVVVDAEDPVAGPPAARALRHAYPDIKLLLLCAQVTPDMVRCVFEEQLEGLALTSDAPEEMILALRHVLEGRAVMPAGWHAASLQSAAVTRRLSIREREVLELASAGLSNSEIAERLVISTNTVKFHLRGIYASLGVHNRVQASQTLGQNHGGSVD